MRDDPFFFLEKEYSKTEQGSDSMTLIDSYQNFLSEVSKSRRYSAIRALQKYLTQPGMVNLGGGLPNPASFPFTGMTLSLKDGSTLEIPTEDVQSALQYGQTKGEKKLVAWLSELQRKVHNPKVEFDICVGHGSQDLMTKAFEMLSNPSDTILIEAPTYVGILAFLRPFGVKMEQINQDTEGISAIELNQVLSNWEKNHPNGERKPTVLYTVATAGNPTGVTTTLERKKEIYEIASRHNVIILEDDPYYYLQYDYPLTPSYFSLDIDGRVMRFDSFSKVLSAGARIGVVTGPFELIDRLQMHQMSTILNPSGISQVILYHYLQKVGIDGFLDHCKGENVSLLYKKRSDVFVKILEKYLTGKATWNVPKGGMFCWIDLSPSNIIDSFELVSQKCINAGVTLVPGQEFFPDSRKCAFVRASFSYSSEKDMDLGIQKLASLL